LSNNIFTLLNNQKYHSFKIILFSFYLSELHSFITISCLPNEPIYISFLIITSWIRTVTDIAGEVVSVGAGVDEFNPGDKIVSLLHFWVSLIYNSAFQQSLSFFFFYE
jgi:hypothetical protein